MKRCILIAAFAALFGACAGFMKAGEAAAKAARAAQYDKPKSEVHEAVKFVVVQHEYLIGKEIPASGIIETNWQFRAEPTGESRNRVFAQIVGEKPYTVELNVELLYRRPGASWQDDAILARQREDQLYLALHRRLGGP